MVSLRSMLAAAAMVVVAAAQVPIAFSSVPAVAVAGSTYNITWGGGDGTPVTLTLRKGNIQDLDTVGIIASKVTNNYYEWTVNKTLATESDYALQITQGLNGINYSGQFAIVGGTGTSSISYSGLTTSTANSTGPGTITTEGVTMSRGTAASMGTGTTMARNTTFSSQSLSAAPKTIATTGATASRTDSMTATQSTSAPTSNVGASMGSSAALVMGIFGAVLFL